MSWFKLEVLAFMASYAALIGLFLLGRKQAAKKVEKAKNAQKESEITVIVPFRNENENLRKLLHSIQNLKKFPAEFIFVNDHSTDDYQENFQELKVNFQLLNLQEGEIGKKVAIRKGVNHAKTEFVLTWDADITVDPDYFDVLVNYPWKEMVILPVYMSGPEFIPGFFAMDYQLQTQANVALSGFFRPITASGANLLFRKETFVELISFRKDEQIPSGDDQFLLKAMREAGKEILVLMDEKLRVKTDAPQSISEGMHQRVRWLSKAGKVQDNFATLFGLFALVVQLSYYGFAAYQTILGHWGATIVMVLIKGELDAFLATYKFQEQFNTLKVFLYQLIYPFYIVALVVSIFFMKSEWKGRRASLSNN